MDFNIVNDKINNELYSEDSYCQNKVIKKTNLILNWVNSKPYQFEREGSVLAGIDIELMIALSNITKTNIRYLKSNFNESINALRSGRVDLFLGVSYLHKNSDFFYFSIPYRFENISLFVLQTEKKFLKFKNTNEFLVQIRLLNFRLGVINGAFYGDDSLMNYFNKTANQDIIKKYDNNLDLLVALTHKEIDGFLLDRFAGNILNLSYNNELLKEIPTGIITSVRLLFSKKTVSYDLVELYNKAIERFINTQEYTLLNNKYLQDIFLLKYLKSDRIKITIFCLAVIFIISTFFYPMSAKFSLASIFIFSITPVIIIYILLDILIYKNCNIFNSITFKMLCYSFIGVSILYFFKKYYFLLLKREATFFGDQVFVICNFIGQSISMIIAVLFSLVNEDKGLIFWVLFYIMIMSILGILIRDISFRRINIFRALSSQILDFGIFVLWGLKLIFLFKTFYIFKIDLIESCLLIVFCGCLLTKTIFNYFGFLDCMFCIGAKGKKLQG